MNTLSVVHQTTYIGHLTEDLNVNTERGPVIFETSHLLLSPHSRGLGQQSGYWELGSGSTAQEYVGLFTTLSQLKMKKNKWKGATS